jgi:hypothetical protein
MVVRISRSRVGTVGMLVVVALCATSRVAAADAPPADNPQFTAWSKFDVGATSTLAATIQAGPQKITSETTQKLAEKSTDQVVLDVSAVMQIAGQSRPIPGRRQAVTRTWEAKDAKPLPDEKVEAAGETFTCKVYKVKQPSPQGKGDVDATIWVSDKVPGGMIKMEAKMANGTMSMLLKSYSAK